MLLVYRVVFVIDSSSYCYMFITLLFLLLVCHFVTSLLHCYYYSWFIMLFVLLLVHCVASSSCCWCCFWFVVLFLNTYLNPSLLILYIVLCYSHEILPPLSSLCMWQIGGSSRCYMPPTTRYPPSPFNLLGAIVGLSHCRCCY